MTLPVERVPNAEHPAPGDPCPLDGPDLDRGRRRVLWLCAGLAVALFVLLGPLGGTEVHHDGHGVHWGVFALVLALYLLAELFEVEIELRRESHSFALTSVPLVIGLFFLPVALVVVARVVASAVVLVGVRHQRGEKLLLNLLSHALEVAVAGAVLVALGVQDARGTEVWLAAVVAVVVADLVGGIVVTAAISLHQGVWEPSLLRGIWVPMAMAVIDVAVALMIVSGLQEGWDEAWLAVPIIVFVVGMTRSYARVVARHHAMARLDAFARDLGAAVAAGDVESSLLPRIADVLRADTAWVWSPDASEPLKQVHHVGGGAIGVEPVTAFDRVSAVARDGVRLYGPRGQASAELAAVGLSEALVECLTVGEGHRVVIGVGDRSGATRRFDQEDARLFSTLCSHAAVSLRNVGLVDRLRAESAENEFLATHDALTGLPNRTLFHRRLEERLAADSAALAVLLVDLDRFKEVNDTLGHASGDELLIEVGGRLRSWLTREDVLARLGGDEFALLVEAAGADRATRRAHEVLSQLRRPFTLGEVDVDVDASIGVALPGDRVVDASGLLRQADVAMYAAKAEHSGVAVYAADLDHYSPKRLAVVGRLRHAIEVGELVLEYQPQVDLADGAIAGVEALVRWKQGGRRSLPPAEFIPLAERTDIIHPLTRHVLAKAIAQAGAWRRAGRPLRVSVNVSARNLVEDDLVESIGAMLDAERLPASALEIELTETTLMANPGRAAVVMRRLRDLGARVAIDDFGTGHSSLSYLTTLDVDTLKIDQSFIAAMAADAAAETIVHAIIDLARNLGLEVVAEGVETTTSARALVRMGCVAAQGFLFSRPLPVERLDPWLVNHDLERLHPAGPGAVFDIDLRDHPSPFDLRSRAVPPDPPLTRP